MSENFISKDFLSKENTTILYKQIIMMNELNNLSKQQKDFIVSQLIETMKRTYKTLDLKKINQSNIDNVKKQYNSIVIKQTSDLIKSNLSKSNDNVNNIINRTNERTFESIKKTIPKPTGIDRPISSGTGNPVLPTQMKVSDDYLKKTTGDLASRLAELENSRRAGNNERPVDIPDWLKPERVGKQNDISMHTRSDNVERKLEGLGGFEDNFKKDIVIDTSKYSDNISIQDRLKKLEAERGMPVSNSGGNVKQSNVSDMFTNTIPSNQPQPPRQDYQPPRQDYQPQPPRQDYQPPRQDYQPPRQDYQPPRQDYQPQPPRQDYQPQPPRQDYQPPPQLLQQLNEMQQLIHTLKQDNEHLKAQIKSAPPNLKVLQMDINKKDAIYNFQFNPINNIISIKLLSYNLPQPVYNIIENTNFVYKMNEMEHSIMIPKGNYNIDNLLNYLNKNNDLIFSVDFTQKVSIKSKEDNIMFELSPSLICNKLGFINNLYGSNILADRIYDLRMPSKLLLYIKNINAETPTFVLNFNNSSIYNLQFNNPYSLSSLQIEFYTEDNVLYNFNDLFYNLNFAIEILN